MYKGVSGLEVLFNRVRIREARDQGNLQAKWSPDKTVCSQPATLEEPGDLNLEGSKGRLQLSQPSCALDPSASQINMLISSGDY